MEKEERERVERELAEQERLAREAEEKRLAKEAEKKVTADNLEDGEIEEQDTQPHNQDGKDKVRESLHIDTTTPAIGRRRHPGPLDLEEMGRQPFVARASSMCHGCT